MINIDIANVKVSSDEKKNMNIQDEISALEAEIAAANARASKAEAEVLKLLSSPNFPEVEKQRILAKMRDFGSKV